MRSVWNRIQGLKTWETGMITNKRYGNVVFDILEPPDFIILHTRIRMLGHSGTFYLYF